MVVFLQFTIRFEMDIEVVLFSHFSDEAQLLFFDVFMEFFFFLAPLQNSTTDVWIYFAEGA